MSNERGGMGCFAKGCLVLLVVLLVVGGLLGLGAYSVYKKAWNYTADTAPSIPIQQATDQQIQEIQGRLQIFVQAVQSGAPAELRLSADDLNTLIGSSADLKGRFHVRIQDSRLFVRMGVPLNDVPGFSGRHLDCEVNPEISVNDGVFQISVKSMQVKGQPVPDEFVQHPQIKEFFKGFSEGFANDPNMAAILSRIKTLQVEGDRIVLHTTAYDGRSGGPLPAGLAPTPAMPALPEAGSPADTRGSSAPTPSSGATTEWTEDYLNALERGRAENKRVLMDFTGSDWCGWCIKLDREVFGQPAFKEYAAKNLVLLKLDFPRSKQLSPAIQQQNEELKNRHGITGYPTIVIVDGMGQEIGRLGYVAGGPSAFTARLESSIRQPARTAAPAAAPTAARPPPAQKPSQGTIVIEGYGPPPE